MDAVSVTFAGMRSGNPSDRGEALKIEVDGVPVGAFAGENVAAALMAAGIVRLRESPRAGSPRGAFCLMGVCQECRVIIDGRLQQACLIEVREGMSVQLKDIA
jgi:predicted molibdopterin-dependent oxidoreductase YjgC